MRQRRGCCCARTRSTGDSTKREIVVMPDAGLDRLERTALALSRVEADSTAHHRLQSLLSSTPAILYTCALGRGFPVTFIGANTRSVLGCEPENFTENPAFWDDRIDA